MPSLLTAGTLMMVRRQRMATMTHTYTWSQRVVTGQDPEGGDVVGYSAGVPGKPCHLLPLETVRVDPSGAPLEVQAPRLVVPWDDPLGDGDQVSDVTITNPDGTPMVVLAGPATVQQTTPQLAGDAPTHKVAVLSFETAQR